MEKQKLLFNQARLSKRGVAEMVLLHISASKGIPSEMVMTTLGLGIAVLRGGNIDIQMVCVVECRMPYMNSLNNESIFKINSGHVKSPEREKRRGFFYSNRWTNELLQCPRLGRVRKEYQSRR